MKTINIRRAGAVLVGLSVLGGAVACGTAKSPRPRTTPTPPAADITKKSGAEIFSAARQALAHASSVHIKGKVTTDDGVVTMNMRIGQGYSTGSITMPIKKHQIPMQIRSKDGRLYIRSPQLLRATGGEFAARVVGDRWFFTSDKKQLEEFGPFIDLTKFGAFPGADGEVTKGGTKVVNGRPAILLKEDDESMFVATAGKPFPLRVAPNTGNDHLDFLEYEVPFTVTVPAHVLNLDHAVSA
ncbi:hypothetical protein [Actinoallomurus rhizosphaericola]|uniref:hypothetical protein n=1 Tax=Actinoallomurus rhizosphaericola TaxID=2952536 RepID=UPI002090CBE4|nr:hypothetical protein [Actinoallomurus rhizosphaericola]MCO5993510.1 hypothetical protein [Actinoallomurus rhizosphaericola]